MKTLMNILILLALVAAAPSSAGAADIFMMTPLICSPLPTEPFMLGSELSTREMMSSREPIDDMGFRKELETARFSMPCIWQAEARFGSIKGVKLTRVGYAGGSQDPAGFRAMFDSANTLEIIYDPMEISYGQLLEAFFRSIDPATAPMNGTVRPIIYYQDEHQRMEATPYLSRLNMQGVDPIYVELKPRGGFKYAEYFQQKHFLRTRKDVMRELERAFRGTRYIMSSTTAMLLNSYIAGELPYMDLEFYMSMLDIPAEYSISILEKVR